MNRKLVSDSVAVILGFYNGEKYIKDQLESIISQTHKNLKVFIFDDNSNEGLHKLKLTLIKKYIQKSNHKGYQILVMQNFYLA